MTMSNRRPKPKWWQLYLTLPLLGGLFLLDTRLQVSTGGHEAVQLGSLALEFLLVQAWLRANSKSLNYMDEEEFSRTIHVIEIPPLEPDKLHEEAYPALPEAPIQIKGVLGNAFEMDYIDANSFNVDAHASTRQEESK